MSRHSHLACSEGAEGGARLVARSRAISGTRAVPLAPHRLAVDHRLDRPEGRHPRADAGSIGPVEAVRVKRRALPSRLRAMSR
jgi:hypothetical protein